jgi:hypothetical protein
LNNTTREQGTRRGGTHSEEKIMRETETETERRKRRDGDGEMEMKTEKRTVIRAEDGSGTWI